MRRRGTAVICNACGRDMFLKNLKNYPHSGWKYVRRLKADICPICVARKERAEERLGRRIDWDELVAGRAVGKGGRDVVVS